MAFDQLVDIYVVITDNLSHMLDGRFSVCFHLLILVEFMCLLFLGA